MFEQEMNIITSDMSEGAQLSWPSIIHYTHSITHASWGGTYAKAVGPGSDPDTALMRCR